MKRWTLRILVLLLLGAIVNVAVAWGCETWSLPSFAAKVVEDAEALEWWKQSAPTTFPRVAGECREAASVGVSYLTIDINFPAHASLFRSERLRSGWPLRCLERAVWTDYARREHWHEHAWIVDVEWKPHLILPLRPIWPGFAINTVFYAVILWLLFAAPFALRRRRRIKRGLCPKCAYDLRNRPPDSTTCPECGATR